MTKDEFEAFYAKNMGMTVEQLRVFNAAIGRDIRPCDCGDKLCQGWQMVNIELYEEDECPLRDEEAHRKANPILVDYMSVTHG